MPGCVTTLVVWPGSSSEEQRAEPVDVIDVDAERVIAVIRVTGRSEKFGTEIDAEWAWLIKARDGKGIEVWIFTDRGQALEAAGLSGSETQVIGARRSGPPQARPMPVPSVAEPPLGVLPALVGLVAVAGPPARGAPSVP